MALENQLTIHQRVKCRFTMRLNNLIPGYKTKRMENMYLHKNVYTNIQSSFIHHGQNMETTQVSVI